MSTAVFKEINIQLLQETNESKPNVTKYDNGKDFSELYYNNETFFQVIFYDRTDATTYNGRTTKINVDVDKIEQLENEVKQYHTLLKEVQNKLAEEQFSSEYDRRTYFHYNRISDDIGFAHFKVFERNQEREDREEREQEKHMKPENKYSCGNCRDGGCVFCSPKDFL